MRGGIRVNCCAWYEVLVQYLIEVEGVLDLGDHAITEEGEPEESPSVQAAYQRRIHAHRMSDRIRDSFLFIWVLQSEVFAFKHKMARCVVFDDPFSNSFH